MKNVLTQYEAFVKKVIAAAVKRSGPLPANGSKFAES